MELLSDIDTENMTRKWIAEILLKILRWRYKCHSCNDNNLAMPQNGMVFCFLCAKSKFIGS